MAIRRSFSPQQLFEGEWVNQLPISGYMRQYLTFPSFQHVIDCLKWRAEPDSEAANECSRCAWMFNMAQDYALWDKNED